MADPHDDLDELPAPPAPAESPGLRDAILRRTQRRLVRVKWARRATRLAAVAAVFAAGVGVGFLRTPDERERIVVVREVEVVAVPVVVVVPVSVSAVEQPPPVAAPTAARLELDAEQADAPAAAKLYRDAGDQYLTAEQDYANAARCYRLFLARAGDLALSPESGDSWLLNSLKNAAFKEKVHATPTND